MSLLTSPSFMERHRVEPQGPSTRPRTQHPHEILHVEQDLVGSAPKWAARSPARSGTLTWSRKARPDGRSWAVEVVQVLTVEEHGLTTRAAASRRPSPGVGPVDPGGCRLDPVRDRHRRRHRVERRGVRQMLDDDGGGVERIAVRHLQCRAESPPAGRSRRADAARWPRTRSTARRGRRRRGPVRRE